MIHKILLWICGIASIIGIILYVIDKTSDKSFSIKLTLGLIFGGIILAVILALTEPKKSVMEEQTNSNIIKANRNTNSPIANNVENQTNNYYTNEANDITKPKSTTKTLKENKAESSGQRNGITANKVDKNKTETIDETDNTSESNSVKSINQQGGITANEVNIYNEKQPLPAKELINETLNSINPQILLEYKSGKNPICIMAQQYKVAKLLERETELKNNGLMQIKSNGSVMNGNSNKMGDCINDRQNGSLNGFVIQFLENY